MKEEKIYQIFSDESGFPSERFQSISLVSGDVFTCGQLRNELLNALKESNLSESKWTKLNGHRPRMELADKFIEIALEYITLRKIRIDILYWDIKDSRHAIQGRDDKANLERMYYKVIRHAIVSWSQPNVSWEIYPDEGSKLDWDSIVNYLNRTKLNKTITSDVPLFRIDTDKKLIQISKVSQKDSHEEPLIQLADLFAGLAKFSKEKGEEYHRWLNSEESKKYPTLFMIDEREEITASKKDIARFTILRKLDRICKKHKMQVSLKTHGYLITKKPSNPLNFWFYIPQKEEDKAPIKRS